MFLGPALGQSKIYKIWLWHIWSQMHMVPRHLSPWTNGPQKFGSPGQMVPNQFSPPGQISSPNNNPFVHGDRLWGYRNIGTKLSKGTKFWGTICPWRPNLMGTFCQRGSILWGSFVQGDKKWGTGSPGIKWVRDQMRRSLISSPC